MRFQWHFRFPPRVAKRLGMPAQQSVKNTIPDVGEDAFLKMLLRDDQTFVAGGANFFVGLCDQAPQETDLLSDISTEPTVTNGYARFPVPRDGTGWPTLVDINGTKGLRSLLVSYTAAGGPFSTQFTRAFLCDVVSGTVGTLFAYSGALSTGILLQDTETFDMNFEFFLN